MTTEGTGVHGADGPADPVVEAILTASRALVGITARSLASVNPDVTMPQYRTLVVLASAGPQTVSALADRLSVHASTMTRMCNRLVSRGLVVRAPSAMDRREVVIALSAMGTSVVENVMLARRAELDAITRRLGDDDRRAVVVALHKFASAAAGSGESGTPAAQDVLEE